MELDHPYYGVLGKVSYRLLLIGLFSRKISWIRENYFMVGSILRLLNLNHDH
jgi:hypothetical protein